MCNNVHRCTISRQFDVSNRYLCPKWNIEAFLMKRACAIPSITRRNGSQELADATLPKTMALTAIYHGPNINPNASTRSAKTRGKQKQELISKKARKIFSSGKVIQRFHIQMRNAMKA